MVEPVAGLRVGNPDAARGVDARLVAVVDGLDPVFERRALRLVYAARPRSSMLCGGGSANAATE